MHEVPLMVIDRESASGQNRTHTQSAIGKVLGDVANIINQTAAALIDQPIRCCAISSFCGAQCDLRTSKPISEIHNNLAITNNYKL
jgi:hypothetical protein